MTEKVFHAELAAAFRASGFWMAKWPDQAISAMQVAESGKLRFALPKPFDLVGAAPDGRFVAAECKLVRGFTFRLDARTLKQLETLRELQARGGVAVLALNFRFQSKRAGRVNRAFLLHRFSGVGWEVLGDRWVIPSAEVVTGGWTELARRTGGWCLPEGEWWKP